MTTTLKQISSLKTEVEVIQNKITIRCTTTTRTTDKFEPIVSLIHLVTLKLMKDHALPAISRELDSTLATIDGQRPMALNHAHL